MRQLTEAERLLTEKIIQLKQAARLEELQVARLLRKELECFALRWVLEPKKTLLFYSTQNNTDWNALRKKYFQVADFLYFIEELEQDRFVKIQTLSFEVKTDEERVLYDRGKYRYKSSDDTFWGIKGDMQYLVPVNAEHKVYIDFVSYLERYANKVIYPLPLLEDFVVNNLMFDHNGTMRVGGSEGSYYYQFSGNSFSSSNAPSSYYRRYIRFLASGNGSLTINARAAGSGDRALYVAVGGNADEAGGGTVVNSSGEPLDDKTAGQITNPNDGSFGDLIWQIKANAGDLITIFCDNGIRVAGISWTPAQ